MDPATNPQTLVLPIKNGEVLFGMKKRGFGQGWWNGFGGKLEDGESIIEAAVREVKEESGLCPSEQQLSFKGIINFYFLDKPSWNVEANLFLWEDYEGIPVESEEMRPKVFSFDTVPYEKMWPADRYFIKELLRGEEVNGSIYFKGKQKPVPSKIDLQTSSGKHIYEEF